MMTKMSAMSRMAYVVSDTSGETASRALDVALQQFDGIEVVENRIPHLRTPAQIAQVMHAARENNGIVFYTLVDASLRDTARIASEECGVVAVDLMAPLLSAISTWLHTEPLYRPGHPHDEKYFARLQALDFAAHHDDGKKPHKLKDADVVILGLSRVSKTPVCTMLATHRVLAANVPIVPGVPLPEELDHVDANRVFVLHKSARRLVEVRGTRLPHLGTSQATDAYVDEEAVRTEVMHVLRLLDAHPGWTRIDMNRSGVEDAAAKILQLHRSRTKAPVS